MRFLLPLLGLWLLLYGSFTLVRPPLLDDADSVHAEVAREILTRHDWITLHANGIRYLEKAPLMYWSMASSFRAFGVADWSARLPLALYALALFLAVFVLGRRLFGSPVAGFYAALVLLTSCGVFLFTRILIPDVMVCLWTTLALGFFWRSLDEESPSRSSAIGFAVVCALNVLTKGLIGVVFPLLIVVVFLLLTRNLRHLLRWHPWLSLLVFLLVAAPWHIAAAMSNQAEGHPSGLNISQGNVHGFFWFYFINEHLLRYVNRRIPRDYDTVPLLLFWGLMLVWIAPWWGFLWRALARVPAAKAARRLTLDTPEQRSLLLAIWAATVLIFFSFSTRQEYYALPALPPLALLAGGWLAEEETLPQQRLTRRIALALLVSGVLGACVAAFIVLRTHAPGPGFDLASTLSQNASSYALSLGHLHDLNLQAMGAFRLPLMLTAAALLLGTAGNYLYRLRGQARVANCFLAGMMAAFLVAAHLALVTFSPVLSSQILAEAIRPELAPGDLVVIHGEYEAGSTLGFYLQRQVHILNGRSSNLWYGSFFDDAPAIFEDNASIAKLWNGPARIFLWTPVDDLPPLPGQSYVVARSGGKEILSNEANNSGASF
ncbi:MAG TPA: glycosyltransferase family 39 protein [Acidisarcina sp.]